MPSIWEAYFYFSAISFCSDRSSCSDCSCSDCFYFGRSYSDYSGCSCSGCYPLKITPLSDLLSVKTGRFILNIK